jgi:hypothetical protein
MPFNLEFPVGRSVLFKAKGSTIAERSHDYSRGVSTHGKMGRNKKNVALATTDKIDTINVKDPLNPNVGALCDRSFGPVAR